VPMTFLIKNDVTMLNVPLSQLRDLVLRRWRGDHASSVVRHPRSTNVFTD
jgi:hypothetical protein